MTGKPPPGPETAAGAVRLEMMERLKTIAGPLRQREPVKAQIARAARKLNHAELPYGVVKRLWYGEKAIVEAHLADAIRLAAEPRRADGFVVDVEGRIRRQAGPGELPAIAVGIGRERITVELRPSVVTQGGLGSVRHWLLGMMSDSRPFRVVDVERGTATNASSSLLALDLVEEAMVRAPGRVRSLIEGRAMVSDESGVRPLDDEALEQFGIAPDASFDVAAYLARNLDVVVFQPRKGRLEVLTRARGRSSKAVEHGHAWLASQPGAIRLRVYLADGWVSEVLASGAEAASRLARLVRLDSAKESRPSYKSTRISLDDVSAVEMQPLQPIMELLSRGFNQSIFGEIMARGLGNRLWVVGVEDGRARFEFIPLGPDFYSETFCFDHVGRRVADQPDREYGKEVEKGLVTAANDASPHYERIQARIREHSSNGEPGEIRHASYGRLVVPFDSRRVVTVSSLIRPPAAA